jgi:hypothetical protein
MLPTKKKGLLEKEEEEKKIHNKDFHQREKLQFLNAESRHVSNGTNKFLIIFPFSGSSNQERNTKPNISNNNNNKQE